MNWCHGFTSQQVLFGCLNDLALAAWMWRQVIVWMHLIAAILQVSIWSLFTRIRATLTVAPHLFEKRWRKDGGGSKSLNLPTYTLSNNYHGTLHCTSTWFSSSSGWSPKSCICPLGSPAIDPWTRCSLSQQPWDFALHHERSDTASGRLATGEF